MTGRVRVLIVDDHPLVRAGLAARLSLLPELELCGEADNVDEALTILEDRKPELMIVDLSLRSGHGLDLIKKAHCRQPATKMLVISAHDESLFASRALRAGADGYVNKQEAQDKVLDAVATVLRGERYLSDKLTRELAGNALVTGRVRSGIESLSDREIEIFELIGRGRSTREVADQLHLSVHTIETHRENMRAKLNLRNGTDLLRSAVQWVLETQPS